jgi:hypothetical protein
MNEYRLTRNRPYMDTNCPGKDDRRSRQGYYITAPTREDALRQMAEQFKDDVLFGCGFTCDLWKENVTR